MHKLIAPFLIGAAAFAVPMLVPSTAHAGLEACGDIHVEASAKCEAIATGGCDVECTNLSFEAACHAEGQASCSGQCNLQADASCTGACDIKGCETKCNGDQVKFDCAANCTAGCDADCAGSCESKCGTDSECKSSCQGSCKATCQGECKGSCTGEFPDCKTKCEASCKGQCEAKINTSCQVDCQSNLQASCTSKLQGGCKAKCESPEGAVKCDGEYVDNNGNAQACLDALTAWTAQINASASGSATASCKNGKCEASAEGEAEASCATAPGPRAGGAAFALGAFGLIAAWAMGRRRRES